MSPAIDLWPRLTYIIRFLAHGLTATYVGAYLHHYKMEELRGGGTVGGGGGEKRGEKPAVLHRLGQLHLHVMRHWQLALTFTVGTTPEKKPTIVAHAEQRLLCIMLASMLLLVRVT